MLIIAVRLLVPLGILRWPLWGSIAAMVADALDVVALDALGVTDYRYYDQVDKTLDTYFYLLQGVVIWNWGAGETGAAGQSQSAKLGQGAVTVIDQGAQRAVQFAKKLLLALLGFRLLGYGLYMLTGLSTLLILFPNLYLFAFLFYLLYKRIFHREPFTSLKKTIVILGMLLVLKLGQEYILHGSDFTVYNLFREHLLVPLGVVS